MSLFVPSSAPQQLLSLGCTYYSEVMPNNTANRLLSELKRDVNWQQKSMNFKGKEVPLPRLTAFEGDAGLSYRYSGIANPATDWTEAVSDIKSVVEGITGKLFNSCLLNLYRNGQDSISYHSDDERDLLEPVCIACVSLGDERVLKFKNQHGGRGGEVTELKLEHGSLLLMTAKTQRYYLHGIDKVSGLRPPRISLTFRQCVSS